MSDLFLSEDDFPDHKVFQKTEVGLLMSLFDVRSRGGRCRGLVSYMFDKGAQLQGIEELICQFGDMNQVDSFMEDERQHLSRVADPVSIDLTVDDSVCVITHEYIPEEGKENLLHVWCTVRDQLFVIRLMIFVRTAGNELQLPVIKDCIGKALNRIQHLKIGG